MAQMIKQGNIFGRIGSRIGQGLAQSVPDELRYQRRKSGLESLAQQSANLSPEELYYKTAGIYDVTPQILQDTQKMAKLRAARNRYGQAGQEQQYQPQPNGQEAVQAGQENQNIPPPAIPQAFPERAQSKALVAQEEKNPRKFENPKIAQNISNPLVAGVQHALPWTQQRYENEVNQELSRNPYLSEEEAINRVNAREARERSLPEERQKQEQQKENARDKLKTEMDNRFKTLLQKPEIQEAFGDLTGKSYLDLIDKGNEILSNDPTKNVHQVAKEMQDRVEEFVTSKSRLKEIANRDYWDSISPTKKDQAVKNLMQIQKSYAAVGQEKELYNTLKSSNISGKSFGLGLSPGGAALISYPRSEGIRNIIGNRDNSVMKKPEILGKKIMENLTKDDSLLSIMRDIKDRNPLIDEAAMWDYFRSNQNGLYPRQIEDLERGESDLFPNWGDIFLFPAFTRSAAND